MKIDQKNLMETLDRITIDKLIEELPFKIHEDSLRFLVTDPARQIVIDSSIRIDNPLKETHQYSFPYISKLKKIVKEMEESFEWIVNPNQVTFKDSEKEIKTDIIDSPLYSSIDQNIQIVYTCKASLVTKNNTVEFSDSMFFNTKDLKRYLDKAKLANSPSFYINQKDHKLSLRSESKSDSIVLNMDLKGSFEEDKDFWLIEFVREILKNNPGGMRIYVKGLNDPIILKTEEPIEVSFAMVPRKGS